MNYNNQINPKGEQAFTAQVMPCRAPQIKSVVSRDQKDGIGGATIVSSGTVYIPTADNVYERTIRYHEALHAAHTGRKKKLIDLLDQALEDARLHRYCSKSAKSEFQRARRDELVVALKDLRQAKYQPEITPSTSLIVFRAMAILSAGKISPAYQRLLNATLARFGKNTAQDFSKALKLLANEKNWSAARKAIKQYFKSAFKSNAPALEIQAPNTQDNQEEHNEEHEEQQFAPLPSLIDEDEEESKKESEESNEEESKEKESEESDEDSENEDSENEDSEDEDSKEEEENSDESEEDSEEDSEEEQEENDIIPPVQAPETKKPSRSSDPDLYTADLTPAVDKEVFEEKSSRSPLRIYIRRLDMSINRVKLSMGRKAPLPVTSGRKILAHRLAGAMSNPSSRVFARSISNGGYGTILIDASCSMSIPEQQLIDFLSKAPALTLAFYNAPSDRDKKGNIFIYAANGYRASTERIGEGHIKHYGWGNVIDYHAMAWLIKQPAPHYIVTDKGWTGNWRDDSERLMQKLIAAKQLIWVKNLAEMEKILDAKKS